MNGAATPEQRGPYVVQSGFPEANREKAATLYFGAFAGKLGRVLGRDGRGKTFIRDVLNPDYAVCCVMNGSASELAGGENLVGIAGFKTVSGSLVGGGIADLFKHYGALGTMWRTPLLSLLEREVEDGVLLMDGIAVSSAHRSQGVGTLLLDAIEEKARELGKATIRLDVIDSNPRARSLYERRGFVAGETSRIGPLRHVFGFSSSTQMTKQIIKQITGPGSL